MLHSDLNLIQDPTRIPINKVFNNTKTSKIVYQYDLEGNFIKQYDSVQEVIRQNPTFDARSIALVASKCKVFNKSANGYQWSYIKYKKHTKYINNSSKAKIIAINIFDCLKSKEYTFNSIADAARTLYSNHSDFDNICACISSSTRNSTFIFSRYLAKNINSVYRVPTRNTAILNTVKNIIYKDAKEAALDLNLSVYKIKKRCKDESDTSLYYMGDCARIKLRESGKLL